MKDLMNRQSGILILIGFVCLIFCSHLEYYYGHFGVDDMVYARMANDLLTGHIDWTNHYSYRWTINGLTAVSYRVFGINDHASALPGLLLSVGIVYGILKCLHHRPWYDGVAAVGLYCLYQWNVFYADKLMPDIYVSACTLMAWYAYRQQSMPRSSPLRGAILFTLGLFFAFLSKGTVVLILPLFAYLFCRDMIRRKHLSFWKFTVGLQIGLSASYLLILYLLTGDPLARFQAIVDNSYFNDCSYSEMPWSATVDRLTTGYYSLITTEYLYIYGLICLSLLGVAFAKRSPISRAAVTIMICLLSANAMTISFSGYNPMCLDPRHYLLFVPIMSVCAIEAIDHIRSDLTSRLILIGLICVSIAVLRTWTPALIGVALALTTWRYERRSSKMITSCIFGMVCLIPSLAMMKYSKSLKYAEFRAEFVDLLDAQEGSVRYYGSHVMNNLGEYYMAFDTSLTTFRDITSASVGSSPIPHHVLLKNWYCDWHSDLRDARYEEWLDDQSIEAVKRDSPYRSLQVFSLE